MKQFLVSCMILSTAAVFAQSAASPPKKLNHIVLPFTYDSIGFDYENDGESVSFTNAAAWDFNNHTPIDLRIPTLVVNGSAVTVPVAAEDGQTTLPPSLTLLAYSYGSNFVMLQVRWSDKVTPIEYQLTTTR